MNQKEIEEPRLTLDEIMVLELFEKFDYLMNGLVENEKAFNQKNSEY